MTILVVGASGATGRLLVKRLIDCGHHVRAIVRSPDKLTAVLGNQERLTVIRVSIQELGDREMARHVDGCDAVVSCLGHNLSWKGVFGPPRRLVTDATRLLCDAIESNQAARPTKVVLMNTAGNSNRDLHEPVPLAQRFVLGLIRLLLPPHVDNERAADHLRTAIGQSNRTIEWVVVRPDTLIDEKAVTEYMLHPSPTRSALFDPGKTSRINVAHFMAALITDEATWKQWKGRMPVIYNRVSS